MNDPSELTGGITLYVTELNNSLAIRWIGMHNSNIIGVVLQVIGPPDWHAIWPKNTQHEFTPDHPMVLAALTAPIHTTLPPAARIIHTPGAN